MRSLLFGIIFLGVLMTGRAKAELIVLSAPLTGDPYYEEVADQIFAFQIGFARLILHAGDDVLILTDRQAYPRYRAVLGEAHVAIMPMEDIWARDFGLSNASDPVLFRYTAAAQAGSATPQADADAVQADLEQLAVRAGLTFKTSLLFNDGGNWVEDSAGNLVVSRKFLSDNGLQEEEAKSQLRALINVDHIAFIEADEQGGLEHADGVVSFVDTNTLIINSYPDDPAYADDLRADLQAALPHVTLHEIATPYDARAMHDDKFGSACGLYTNALVTPDRVYLPQFGVAEDAEALATVRSATNKEVIPVPSSGICFMGGGVRCMSWQLRGKNAAALRQFFR